MRKIFIATTIPLTFVFFKGNLRFLSQRFEVCAISSEEEILAKVGEQEGIRTYCIPMVRSISLIRDINCLFRFIIFFIKERPSIVHGNTPKASMLSMLASWIARVPVRIYMCHGLRYQGIKGKLRKILMWMEKLSCNCSTEVICVSKGVRDTLIVDNICSASKAVVIGNGSAGGLDLDWFSSEAVDSRINIRNELAISDDAFVFIFVGRIVADKGVDELVGAFFRLQESHVNIHLILVGNEEKELNPITPKARSIINGNTNIHAVGAKDDVRPYLLGANAFVFPSYREGFGMVLIEAGAMGLPCISSDIIGCNEIIRSNENGELIPPRNAEAIYVKMKDWVENPENVKRMGLNARRLVEERYEQKKVWNALLAEYTRLINKKNV